MEPATVKDTKTVDKEELGLKIISIDGITLNLNQNFEIDEYIGEIAFIDTIGILTQGPGKENFPMHMKRNKMVIL